MKRLSITLLGLFLLVGCRDSQTGSSPDELSGTDAGGVSLPDARIVSSPVGDAGTNPDIPSPTLNQVSPNYGPETGGTRVTLRGTSFVEPAEVFFQGIPATNVVVLDQVSIAATTPAGVIGPADVRVITPGGVADLPRGFRYHLELRIDSISPQRLPEEGGVPVTITGKGFDDLTVVLLDRKVLRGTTVVDSETITGYAPALAPGRPEIHVFNADAEVSRSDLAFVYATPKIESIAPGFAPVSLESVQGLTGEGFQLAENIKFGSLEGIGLEISGDEATRVDVTAPGQVMPGAYDVVVENSDASDTLASGFIVFDPNATSAEIIGVVPSRVEADSETTVTIIGHNMPTIPSRVQIGGQSATVVSTNSSNEIAVLLPTGLSIGEHDVDIFTFGSTLSASRAINVFDPVVLTGVSPQQGPASGGTIVTITGSGFTQDVIVRIADVPLTDLAITPTQITGKTVAGAHGLHDVVVSNADSKGTLEDSFKFIEEFAIIRLKPDEGSIAGNTYVTALGRGFDSKADDVSITFDGEDVESLTVENGSIVSFRTKPADTGAVDVDVVMPKGLFTFKSGFNYYDPRIVTGGAWGGPIDGSVNVGVLDIGSGRPLAGFVVQLGVDNDVRYTGVTDENGLVTISAPEIAGEYTVTAGREEYEFVTYMELNARNVTMLTSAYPSSPSPDDPVPPCPTGGPGPVVRGKIYRFKSSLDQTTRPGWRPVARITYTQPSVFQTNPPMPASQVDYVFEDGGEYEITPARVGTIAVYAILGDYNEETQEFVPRRMGIARQVPSAAGVVTDNINIPLDIELTKEVEIRLDNPPAQLPGPTTVSVAPYLNLGSEGVIAFPGSEVLGETTVVLNGLPDLAGAKFFYLAGSYTTRPDGTSGAPLSETLHESGDETAAGIDVGPFVDMPQDVSPKPNQLAVDGKFSWIQPGAVPNLTRLYSVDVTSVSACCCVDGNMNGTCEADEPQMCGGAPVQFVRWSVFGPGGLQSYEMPPNPLGVQAYDSPGTYFWVVEQAIAPRFNYNEFIYNQYSRFFWKSWSLWYSQFVSKESTD
ncbi:MAG: IPT/TIG domain-containing protein [Myxococcota bacterium]|nr:IPT/TIG domain-containing protein [Myxococcota bacterium]